MDFNDENIKQEFLNLLNSIKSILPKLKEEIIERMKPKVTRLSDIHSESKTVFPNCFVGLRSVLHGDLMDKVKIVQHLNLGHSKNNNYNCYKRYFHNELEPAKTEKGMVLNSSGAYVCSTALYRESYEGGYELRVATKIKNLLHSHIKVDFEKETSRAVALVGCSIRDLRPTIATQWIYKITNDLSVGSELRFGDTQQLSLNARFHRGTFVLSSTYSSAGMQICLFKKFAEDLRIACILSQKIPDLYMGRRPHIALALHKQYGVIDLKFFVDNEACAGFTHDMTLHLKNEMHESLLIKIMSSCLINRRGQVLFGFGFNIGCL